MRIETETGGVAPGLAELAHAVLDAAGETPLEETLKAEWARISSASAGATTTTTPLDEVRSTLILGELQGFGPISPLMKDSTITEILVNGPGEIFFERGGEMFRFDGAFLSERTYGLFVKRVLSMIDRAADRRIPFGDGYLADGTRVHVALPPVVKNPVVSLRRHTYSRWRLDDLKEKSLLSARQLERLKEAVALRENILVCGPTGVGKTTLLRALLFEVAPLERIVSIEDSDEIGLDGTQGVALFSRTSPEELAPEITLCDLLRQSLRMRPDRLIVGEIRGLEALVFLDAVSTGHRGSMSSIHAENARQALLRLESLISRAAPQWAQRSIRQLVFEGVDLIISLEKKDRCRKIHEICELSGIEDFGYLLDTWQP